MRVRPSRALEITDFLLEHVGAADRRLVPLASERFGITRQAVHAHLTRLVQQGRIEGRGRTRSRTYHLATLADLRRDFDVAAGLDEDATWREQFAPTLSDAPANVVEICRFGLTECLRNAADHSGSAVASARLRRNAVAIEMSVSDQGQGIFRRLDEDDPLRAALDLVKGGRSSDPDRRAGRGFTSVARAFDSFSVWSGRHHLRRESRGAREDWRIEELGGRVRGTTVAMAIRSRSRRTLLECLGRATTEGSAGARPRAEVPVRMALRSGEPPTSRTAARRLLERMEGFGEVVLDFAGVETVGPAFADEVFRVFRRENPEILVPRIGTTPAVERILRIAEGSGPGA